MSKLSVKLCSENATMPTKGSKYSAGYDLYSAEDETIPFASRGIIDTGIAIKLPDGVYGRIAPRSGLALKHGLDVGGGVVDADYTATLKVILFNHGPQNYHVKKGDRVAQLILEKIENAEIDRVDEIIETDRGSNGFGSTGV